MRRFFSCNRLTCREKRILDLEIFTLVQWLWSHFNAIFAAFYEIPHPTLLASPRGDLHHAGAGRPGPHRNPEAPAPGDPGG